MIKLDKPVRWTTAALFYARVTRGKRALTVVCSPDPFDGSWKVIALESNARGSTQDIFDNHAHRDVGTFTDLFKAAKAAERYARTWRSSTIPQCKCAPIDAT